MKNLNQFKNLINLFSNFRYLHDNWGDDIWDKVTSPIAYESISKELELLENLGGGYLYPYYQSFRVASKLKSDEATAYIQKLNPIIFLVDIKEAFQRANRYGKN